MSWAAKFGIDRSTRRTLGYHCPAKDRMVEVYSRDTQAEPMRKLEALESALTHG